MKKFAVVAMSAVAFLSTLENSEGQILRRFRDNVREAMVPQAPPQQQMRSYNPAQMAPQTRMSTPQQYVQPQVRTQRPAAASGNAGPQKLTPYSKLTPQQRASQSQQASGKPRLNAPVPVGRPAAAERSEDAKVRIVTYFDPRSGRTFQRRYLIPANAPAANVNGRPGQVVTGRRSILSQPPAPSVATRRLSVPGRIENSTSMPSTGSSLVPPIQLSPQQTASTSPVLLPALVGPSMSAPNTATAQSIATSIESPSNSRVETASAEIPDLTGVTVEQAPLTAAEKKGQDYFFADDENATNEESEVPSYSVLEAAEDE